jgi:NADH-quinone oxidoreductase subunit C
MEAQAIYERLSSLVGDAVSDFTPTDKGIKDAFCKVKADRWLEVAKALRDDVELGFDFLQCVTAVDWPKRDVIEVVYHLYSYPKRHAFVVKADLPRTQPLIPSVAGLWIAAEWNEREQFDLLGVGFTGHPDLRRVLMPDDWVGYPMRKDYKESPAYRGMSTTRPSPLNLLVIYDKAPPEKKHAAASDELGEDTMETSDE